MGIRVMRRITPHRWSALALAFWITLPLAAQEQNQHHHHPQEPPPAEPQAPEHDMSGMQGHEGHDMHSMEGMDHGTHVMRGMLGPYSMSREASGTAWQPESTPHLGLHTMWNGWHLMTHGFANLVYDHQGSTRGDEKVFSENMLMGMASRDLGPGHLGLRAMLSAEPWTIGKNGYPLLLQTGETANGVTPLIDRQHPHDMLMELAATYSVPVGTAGDSAFVYVGWPGEPALGPATFMHRFSGMENPEAPIGHHWLDSTHVTFGVATLGWIRGNVKLEGSVFTGREPDENRADLETPKMDSWSLRASWQPTPDWSLQVSHGYLHRPEQLEPEVDTRRTAASAIYNRPLPDGDWQTTFAWGRNDHNLGGSTNSFLVESAATRRRHTLFGRFERQENGELEGHLIEGDSEAFLVGKLSLGYIYDFVLVESRRAGVGILGSVAQVPERLAHEEHALPSYGEHPVSWMVFLRVRM
jgi:hypothetical protein